MQGGKGQPVVGWTQILSKDLGVQGWGQHGQGMPYPSDGFKPVLGGPEGMQLTTPLVTAIPANSRPLTFPPQPQTKASQHEGSLANRPTRSHHSCSIFKSRSCCLPGWMIQWGPCNHRVAKVTMLISQGPRFPVSVLGSVNVWPWKSTPWAGLLELESTGISTIPCLGYIEVNLQIPGIKGYNQDILLLVILTMTYSKNVSVMVGSKIIDQAMGMMTKGELMRATVTWKQAHLGAVMSGHSRCPAQTQREMWKWGRRSVPPQALTLWHPGSSAWMMSGDLSVPLRGLPFPHLGPLAYLATQVSGDTTCGSTYLLSWHKTLSCPLLWYRLPHRIHPF